MNIDISDEQIAAWIKTPKTIVSVSSPGLKPSRGHHRKDCKLKGEDGSFFSLFIRVSDAFSENFSVGLLYDPQGGPDEPGEQIPLIRCNGPHGPSGPDHHRGPHIHRAKEANLDERLKVDHGCEPTTVYNDWRAAVRYIAGEARITDWQHHFPDCLQPELPLEV